MPRQSTKSSCGSSRRSTGSLSHLEEAFALQLRAMKLPTPEREYKFHPSRNWRFDFAWPDLLLAVEIEGGIWGKGGHSTGQGITRDIEKGNEASRHGWKVFRFTGQHVTSGHAIRYIEAVLADH